MDRIKFDQNDNQNYPIDKNLFEKKTRKSKLFNRKNASNEINQYAILMDLYRLSDSTKNCLIQINLMVSILIILYRD